MNEPSSAYGRCDCGAVTTFRCHELWPPNGMIACRGWLCRSACPQHHHEPGTMGYWNADRVSASYVGDEPDGPGLWQWLKSQWRAHFWPDARKAQHVWDRFRKGTVPPAPLPRQFHLRFAPGVVYEAVGLRMLRMEGEHD